MLKRIIPLISSLILILVTSCTVAKNAPPVVTLYADINSTKVVATVPLQTRMVPIIYKQGWAKVGLRPSGQVGWINLSQYEKARRAFYEPTIQTVYINTTQDANGKPTVNIIAYRNGKKLSEKQAHAFYKKMVQQQRSQQRADKRYWKQLMQMMRKQQHDMDQMMQSDVEPPIILMPGPVLLPGNQTQPAQQSNTTKPKASH